MVRVGRLINCGGVAHAARATEGLRGAENGHRRAIGPQIADKALKIAMRASVSVQSIRVPFSKFRAFMKKILLSLVLLPVLAGFITTAHAEKADRSKPMNIEADALRYDDVKQISIFTGHVVLTKGTIIVRGERLEVRQDPEGYQFALVTGSAGAPAFFRQKREAVDEFIEGESETIDYDGRADRVKFITKAQMRRFRGTSLADEIRGAVIVYDNSADTFSVDGNPANTPKTAGSASSGRVRVMLIPKPETSKPEAGAPSTAPTTAPAVVSPALRSTPALGSVPE
jgi:lipopolysaccharide export system protein LptA